MKFLSSTKSQTQIALRVQQSRVGLVKLPIVRDNRRHVYSLMMTDNEVLSDKC